MPFVAFLLLVWFLLTLWGMWAIVRLMMIRRQSNPRRMDTAQDLQAADRVLNRLRNNGIIAKDDEQKWRAHLTTLKQMDWHASIASSGEPRLADIFGTPTQDSADTAQTYPDIPVAEEVESPVPEITPSQQDLSWLDRPKVVPAAEQPGELVQAELAPETSPPETRQPSLTMSEVISSFLAAHNIRWGELVAGMLIVICSIGLVISLWNTLIETHRVVPSLIFLAANTAIFSAGLYTLSRWKLRHTSRAMLVIAMLLVPLSILAGLATAGTGEDAVLLNDPITLAAILGIGAVYLVLLWQGSKALVGQRDAGAMVLGVAGPAAMLPLLPAAVRILESSAAYLVAGGCIALATALSWVVSQSRQTRRGILGTAAARHRILIMSVSSFSVAMLIGDVALTMPEFPHQLLRIAIAAIPGMVALAAIGATLNDARRQPNLALAGTSIAVIGMAAAFVVLAPAMIGPDWLWRWAIVLSGSAALSAWAFRQPLWLPLATIAAGVALLIWSPVYFQGIGWQELPLWRRFVGGEPMLSALAVGVITLAAGWLIRPAAYRQPLQLAGLGWVAASFLLATLLSVAPQAWLGSVPPWVVSALLAVVAVGCMGAPHELIARYGCWATVPFWLSIFRPVGLGLPLAEPRVWMMTLLAIAATLVSASEVARRWRSGDTIIHWQQIAGSISGAAAAVAIAFVSYGWTDSACTLLLSGVLLWWLGVSSQQLGLIQMGQVCSLAAAIVVGWGQFYEPLFAQQSWQTGVAPWVWAALIAAVTLCWLVVRELCQLALVVSENKPLVRPLAWYNTEANATRALDWAMMQGAVIAIVVAAAHSFAALTGALWTNPPLIIAADYGWTLISVLLSSITLLLTYRTLRKRYRMHWRRYALGGGIAVIAWLIVQASVLIVAEPAQRLVIGTTLIASGCGALDFWIRSSNRITDSVGKRIAACVGVLVVSVSSVTLLETGWVHSVFAGETPNEFHSWSVTIWWLCGALLAGWIGWRQRDSVAVCVSAGLTPAAVALVMPLASDTPMIWLQWAAIASGVWALLAGWCFQDQAETAEPARGGSLAFLGGTGIVCAVMAIVYVLIDSPGMGVFGSWGGLLASVFAAAMLIRNHHRFVPEQPMLLPLAGTLLSGQATNVATKLGLADRLEFAFLASIWLAAAASSLVYLAWSVLRDRKQPVIHFWHAAFVSVAMCILCTAADDAARHLWLGVGGCLVGGSLLAIVSRIRSDISKSQLVCSRLLGWFVLGIGCYFVTELADVASGNWDSWTAVVSWIGVWIVVWRLACPDAEVEGQSAFPLAARVLPDGEAALLISAGMLFELFLIVAAADRSHPATLADPMLWLRVVVVGVIATSAFVRSTRTAALESGMSAAISTGAIIAVCVGAERGADWQQRFMLASLTASTMLAMLVYLSRTGLIVVNRAVANGIKLLDSGDTNVGLRAVPVTSRRFGIAMWRISLVATVVISVTVIACLIRLDTDRSLPLTIGAVALLAIAVAELAEMTGQLRMRYATVLLGFLATGMWASVNVGGTPYPLLTTSMQWLVAWVLTAAIVGLAIPKLLGAAQTARWQPALRFGVILAGALAGGSMTLMFAQEAWIRFDADIDLVSRVRVGFVAATLAALSAIATSLGILSGPRFRYRETWRFADQTRIALIVSAQVIGGLTWLHLHLCKSPLAHLGLRPYWPYIVMILSFASVGISAWAKRRGDVVLRESLRQTALYLPLIPVLGFWLSTTTIAGGEMESAWTYIQGRVSYQSLLVIAALYYGGLAFIWRGTMPRVTSLVLGNAALWVILIQMPNWSFLSHPQAWLIPSAVCVLIVTHLYRDRLDASVSSGIRYAATLTIYISSTADMLLQDIGATLSGPIILVLLALGGMIAGIVLRVRPFLYLGAIFVFIGVTSMVWHAQQRIDAVWPWWAFGITTGILLLAGLMAIEKNKPKLQMLARSLAKWEP